MTTGKCVSCVITMMSAMALLFLFTGLSFAGEGAACPYCGMEKAKFAHSWVEIDYDNGTSGGFCSLHCAAIDMALHLDKTPKAIRVGSYKTRNLIDAEKAFWVIGGDRMGVMTTRAKWAFENKDDADAFMKDHGGVPATYENAVKATFEDMYEDIRMIQKKRKMMRMRKQKTQG
ncbi:NosL family protein [Desulfonema ishimotonii]|uniref:NosL family protein n=1 Tax=Desulfonema ishimotonii TaxID=45657 RepID=A0A401FY76_9BACT|nr:nitrous oxide reductase accessory protein NosL [Desulfonema ishimotonii]GBC61921.1 NosL family protein [Desulfonema ishimotonii]